MAIVRQITNSVLEKIVQWQAPWLACAFHLNFSRWLNQRWQNGRWCDNH